MVRPDRELGDAWLARIARCSLVLLSVTTCLLAARVVSRQVSAQASLSALQPGGEEQVGAHWAELLQVSHTSTLQCYNEVRSGLVIIRSGQSHLSESLATSLKCSRQMLAQLRLP